MWIASTSGFFSIVRKGPGVSHIRARSLRDLQTLQKRVPALPEPERSYNGSDYPYRIICDSDLVPVAVAALARDITYGNFKSAVGKVPAQQDKLPAYHAIWQEMQNWQFDSAEKRTTGRRHVADS